MSLHDCISNTCARLYQVVGQVWVSIVTPSNLLHLVVMHLLHNIHSGFCFCLLCFCVTATGGSADKAKKWAGCHDERPDGDESLNVKMLANLSTRPTRIRITGGCSLHMYQIDTRIVAHSTGWIKCVIPIYLEHGRNHMPWIHNCP